MTTRTRRNGPGSFSIETLVDAVAEASETPRYARLKPMLTRHHQVKKVLKAPVYVGLYIAPAAIRSSGESWCRPTTWCLRCRWSGK